MHSKRYPGADRPPFDRLNMLSGEELSWVNDYHARVPTSRRHVDAATKVARRRHSPLSL